MMPPAGTMLDVANKTDSARPPPTAAPKVKALAALAETHPTQGVLTKTATVSTDVWILMPAEAPAVAATAAKGPVVKPEQVTVTEPAGTDIPAAKVIVMVLAVASMAETETVAGAGLLTSQKEVVEGTAVIRPAG